MAVILDRPKIINQFPSTAMRFIASGNKLASENCQLDIEVTFSNGQEMNCAVRVRIDRKFLEYFTLEPNSTESNQYEIYRYYGRITSGKMDTFNFRLKSDKTLSQIKAYASPVFIIVTVYDCDYRDVKAAESVKWNIV
ncbi:hypothetical protein [Flavobacterium sp. FlaQc-48]|uniref:hypothetical protein n=1 Tax=Flavobacterium sp. FlaQc-48 TaxID=3374181 RepID=UPI0037576857